MTRLQIVAAVIQTAGLALSVIGAILVGRMSWTFNVIGQPRPLDPDTYGNPKVSVGGATSAPADLPRWRCGWRLIWAGFIVQAIATWLPLIQRLR